jgi:hypothetical protein
MIGLRGRSPKIKNKKTGDGGDKDPAANEGIADPRGPVQSCLCHFAGFIDVVQIVKSSLLGIT